MTAQRASIERFGGKAADVIKVPVADPFVAASIHAVPGRILSYPAAVAKGTQVDQPVNRQQRHSAVRRG